MQHMIELIRYTKYLALYVLKSCVYDNLFLHALNNYTLLTLLHYTHPESVSTLNTAGGQW